ncbi:hypothetical protein Pla110_07880 [Polystyrenella longa]|uniref:Uncharacterized protein n=1 Tax=Polystyrenella longa TaxID=2528007 RepID=A0A518CIS8_9PLAN|nr:hypothetical protein [Polystyrenella longa]QDU79084.1 hypothetical protein Pla110_07880 [Polystyrenella longa]
MAMDLPRSLGFGMLCILCCVSLMAQEQEEYTVSRSESSFRQSNGIIAVPTEEALDAYEEDVDLYVTPEEEGEIEYDLAEAQDAWDARYPEPNYGLPMAPPVDQQFRPRQNRALKQAPVNQAAWFSDEPLKRTAPRELPQSHLNAQPVAQDIRPLAPAVPQEQVRRQAVPEQRTAQSRSSYARNQPAAAKANASYYHAQQQPTRSANASQGFVAPVAVKAGLNPKSLQQQARQPVRQAQAQQHRTAQTRTQQHSASQPRAQHQHSHAHYEQQQYQQQHAQSGYLARQNRRVKQPVRREQHQQTQHQQTQHQQTQHQQTQYQQAQYQQVQQQYEMGPVMMSSDPNMVYMREGEVFEAPEMVMDSGYDSFIIPEYYGAQEMVPYDNACCSDCGDLNCYGSCGTGGCAYGSDDPLCNCNDCTTRRFCGRHPQSRFKSDYAFADFIEPITNPYWFIDPRSMTRARLVVMNQDIPRNNVTPAGSTTVTSLQGSLAVGERMSFLAAKTGRATFDLDGQSELDGWLDMAFGFKTVLVRDEYNRFLLSAGSLYERSNGTSEIFQGNGHGMWHIFLTGGKGWGRSHFVSTVGWHLPNNHDEENESLYYSFHYDLELFEDKFLVLEMNGQHYTESGSRTPNSNLEGGDLFSLGSDNVTGNDVITGAIGTTIRLRDDIHLTAAYEVPLTSREDFLDDRFTATLAYYY